MESDLTYTAFAGDRQIASGPVETMLLETKTYLESGGRETVLIFEDQTGKQVDFDFRGTPAEVLARLATHPLFAPAQTPEKSPTGPGRPKLGVISREVSLLPRHWDWLEQQPVGISSMLRKLVDEARKHEPVKDHALMVKEAMARFMSAMAGNFPGYEEATRALYAGKLDQLAQCIEEWPKDIRDHINRLVTASEPAKTENI